MKLKRFKERDNKIIGIIVFTIACILLVSGVIFYRTFAIFEVKTNQNVINGQVGDMGDLRFMVYINGELQKDMPNKNSEYSLDTSKSYCEDVTDSSKRSHISWNQEKWSIEIKDIGTTKTKCYLYFDKLYVDSTLNEAIPDLGNELVAITFDEENGHALKADLTSEWYDYSKQEWANAVILRTKEDYEVGQQIPEENIESYFVWIPRYEYEIWNGEEETSAFTSVPQENVLGDIGDATAKEELNQAKTINVTFVTKDKPIQSGNAKGTKLTHPAFTSFDSNGFWVGKFETGYNQDGDGESDVTPDGWTVGGAEKDEINSNKIIIKPNVYSWRKISVAKAFYTSYDYRRSLDSHMMKNMEWGAVAYLTNSQYGRCNGECTEVRINNSSNSVTGSSAVSQPICGWTGSNLECNKYEGNALGQDTTYVNNYNNSKSIISSTTNNYYGVFDMAGGSWEYVMGVMVDQAGNPVSGYDNSRNSNFVGTLTKDSTKWTTENQGFQWPDEKYYDAYRYQTVYTQFQGGKLGDGTKEFGPFYSVKYSNTTRQVSGWNADEAYFSYTDSPWFVRGGSYTYGSSAGIADFFVTYGYANTGSTFRVILTP